MIVSKPKCGRNESELFENILRSNRWISLLIETEKMISFKGRSILLTEPYIVIFHRIYFYEIDWQANAGWKMKLFWLDWPNHLIWVILFYSIEKPEVPFIVHLRNVYLNHRPLSNRSALIVGLWVLSILLKWKSEFDFRTCSKNSI